MFWHQFLEFFHLLSHFEEYSEELKSVDQHLGAFGREVK
jgi:hypothetical protein